MRQLNTQSAVALRRMIGNRQISPVDVVTDCIAAVEDRNPSVNAVVTTTFEDAAAAAKKAEAEVMAGNELGPLHGLPVLIKDLADTAGVRTTYGSKYFATHVPHTDAVVVEKLKAAGAIVIGKTNTPEFGAGANTSNKVFGATGNPFNTSLTSGGSSGGSAAALACDMAPLATGSDLGGSLRIPASFCSVVGMRPSPGVVPSKSHVSGFSPLWSDGPMARSVEDLALMLSAISGFDQHDPLSTPASDVNFDNFYNVTDLAKVKIGFSTDLGVAAIEDDVRAVFDARKPLLSRYVGDSCELDIDMSAATDVFTILRAESIYAAYGDLVREQGEELSQNVVNNVLDAQRYSLMETAAANAAHTRLFRSFQTIFDKIDVLICPATAVSPFPVKENHPSQINGRALDGYFAWYAITWVLSLVGCPIVTIPCGLDHKGMPFGVQLVGRRHTDLALTRIASAFESILENEGVGRVRPSF
ncbi:MAG: amidase [Roseobacter sp.]